MPSVVLVDGRVGSVVDGLGSAGGADRDHVSGLLVGGGGAGPSGDGGSAANREGTESRTDAGTAGLLVGGSASTDTE